MKEQIKKVVFVALVAAVSIAARAEILYWTASGIKSSSATAAGDKTYLAYIFADTDSGPNDANMFKNNSRVSRDTIKGMLANKQDVTTYALKNATVGSDGGTPYSDTKGRLNSYDSNSDTAYYSNEVVGWIGKGGSVDLFAVILDATSWDSASNYMFLETSSEGTISTTSNNSGTGTFNFGSQANNSWYAIGTAIPEPTSGLLLVLGMATLALKRRRV